MAGKRLQTTRTRALVAAAVAVLVIGAGGDALADSRSRGNDHGRPAQYDGRHHQGHGQRGGHHPQGYDRYDSRWQHDRYYPRHGYVAPYVPHGAVVVKHYHRNYWYAGGVWYAPYGPRFTVVAPPVGIYVNVLPPYYTTVWFGGIPYYYANDSYYAWRASARAYQVVEPPVSAQATTASPATEDIFVYPKAGQTPEQVASDRYACHRWAADQTGFDPTRPEGGVPSDQARSSRGEYFRAMTACLEGRGYSVT